MKLARDDFILLKDGYDGLIVCINDISFIEVTGGNYLSLKLNNGSPSSVTIRGSLARYEERLPTNFFRAGRDCIVNLAEVAKVNTARKQLVLTMKDGKEILVSRIQSRLLIKQLIL